LFFFRPLDDNGNCPKCAEWLAYYEQQKAERERREREAIEKEQAKIDAIPDYKFELSSIPCKRQRGFDPVAFSNITPKGKYDSVVVFDTETTGLAPSHDRIVEIAAIKYTNGEPVQKFHSFINPGIPIPERVIEIHGITDDMVKDCPNIGQVIPAFDDFIGDSILSAHNLEFDLKFIFYSGSHFYERFIRREKLIAIGSEISVRITISLWQMSITLLLMPLLLGDCFGKWSAKNAQSSCTGATCGKMSRVETVTNCNHLFASSSGCPRKK